MAITHVQDTFTTAASVNVLTATLTSAVGGGNTLVATFTAPAGVTVAVVDDNRSNPWIRVANSYNSANCEMWYSRGVQAGTTTVTAVFNTTASVAVAMNVAEFAGVWYVDPLDTWSANYGSSASPTATGLQPRGTGELFVGVVNSASAITATPSGYTALTLNAGAGAGAAYRVLSTAASIAPAWTTSASAGWSVAGACFVTGQTGLNARLQFPELLVEMSTQPNYLAPLQGKGVWTNISSYVRSATLGPIGRQHELDRVQASAGQIVVTNRDGSFNPWNARTASVAGTPPTEVTSQRTFLTSATSSKTYTIRLPKAPTAGHLLLVVVQGSVSGGQTQMLSSGSGGAWVQQTYSSSSNMGVYTKVAVATDTTITVTMANTSTVCRMLVTEWSGADSTNNYGVDVVNGPYYTGSGTSVSSGATGISLVANSAVLVVATQQAGNTVQATSSYGSTVFGSATAPTASSSGGLSYWATSAALPSGVSNLTDTWTSSSAVGMTVISLVTSNVGTTATSGSFLWNNGYGLNPMNPVKVTAAWAGTTYPVYYGYTTAFTQALADSMNADMQISATDIFQNLALKYLSSPLYAQQVLTNSPVAYYRLNDPTGSTAVADYTGNGNIMTAIAGTSGLPYFGNQGFLLYDISTSADLTNQSNTSNAGIVGYTNTGAGGAAASLTPIPVNPQGSASVWSFESWVQWTGGTDFTKLSNPYQFSASASGGTFNVGVGGYSNIQFGWLLSPSNAHVVANFSDGTTFSVSGDNTFSSATQAFNAYPTNFTVFGASVVSGQLDLRIGTGMIQVVGAPAQSQVLPGRLMWGIEGLATSGDATSAWPTNSYVPLGFSNVANLTDGHWHHIVVTYSAGTLSFYVDGVLDSTFTTSYNLSLPTRPTIGCNSYLTVASQPLGTPTSGFPGSMQEVALYTYALSASAVAMDYNYGRFFQTIEYGASVGGVLAGRLNKALAVIGLDPTIMLKVPYPFKTQLYGEQNVVTTTSHLNYLQTTTETEPGIIFQGTDGYIYAYNRQYQYLNPTSASTTFIYGDNPWASYRYDGVQLQIVQDDLDLWNDVQAQSGRPADTTTNTSPGVLQEWGPYQSAAASLSAQLYGARTMQGLTSLQQQNDTDVLALAQQYLAWYNLPLRRVQQLVQSSAGNNGANIVPILSAGLIDRVTVQYQGQTPGPVFTQDSVIESIQHTITIDNGPDWTTTWALSPYEILSTPLVFGSSGMYFGGSASVTAGQLTL